jgi:hypothetical protein
MREASAAFGSVVGAAEALEVVDGRGAVLVVGGDVVVLEQLGGGAAGVAAARVAGVEDASLSSGGVAATGTGIDGPGVGVVDEQRDEGPARAPPGDRTAVRSV